MSPAPRSRWQWLADLVSGEVARRRSVDLATAQGVRLAVSDALCRLGWSDDDLVDGLATVLETTPGRLRAPDRPTVVRIDPDRLAVVLDALLQRHEGGPHPLALVWLQCPAVAYQVPPAALEHWLARGGPAAALMIPRLANEGLALLGPDALGRLASVVTDPQARAAAERWLARMA